METPVIVALITASATVLVAVIGVGVELLRRQGKRISEVREHVANSHETNLRHDVDKVLAGLDQVLANQTRHDSEIGSIRKELQIHRLEHLQQ